MKEIILNVIIGILTGIISGIISGAWVTRYYRNKDHISLFKKELTDVYNTMKVIIEQLESGDIDTIRNILSFQMYNVFDDIEARLTPQEEQIIDCVIRTLTDLRTRLITENTSRLTEEEIDEFRNKLQDQLSNLERAISKRRASL